MCTVTFLAWSDGYCLGMNRDEKRSRVAGLPPSIREEAGRRVLHPSEPGGGTWIGVNDSGITLALINWYSVRARVAQGAVSRGEVVQRLLRHGSSPAVAEALASPDFPLARLNPFRLIGICPGTQQITEWRWDLRELSGVDHAWAPATWISSGHDEPGAQETRGRAFLEALLGPAGDPEGPVPNGAPVEWLQRLHRSHLPERGPYSTCMHRPDAVTVSHTEITVGAGEAWMRHGQGSPCEEGPVSCHSIPVRVGPAGERPVNGG